VSRPPSGDHEQPFRRELANEVDRVGQDLFGSRVVLAGQLVGDLSYRPAAVAELPDPGADLREREVASALRVEQDQGLVGARERNAPVALGPQFDVAQKLNRVRWRSSPSRSRRGLR
jgi:hypothetical protein